MNEAKVSAIKSAFADLCGSLQAYDQSPYKSTAHNWEWHGESILDLIASFPELELKIPANLKHLLST